MDIEGQKFLNGAKVTDSEIFAEILVEIVNLFDGWSKDKKINLDGDDNRVSQVDVVVFCGLRVSEFKHCVAEGIRPFESRLLEAIKRFVQEWDVVAVVVVSIFDMVARWKLAVNGFTYVGVEIGGYEIEMVTIKTI